MLKWACLRWRGQPESPTLLHSCCWELIAHQDVCLLLLTFRYRSTCCGCGGLTALHICSRGNPPYCFSYGTHYVATVKATSIAGFPVSVLDTNRSFQETNCKVITEVFDTWCKIYATDNHGMTPLHVKAVSRNTELHFSFHVEQTALYLLV